MEQSVFLNYANKFMTSFFLSFFASSICFICSIESNFVSSSPPTDIKSHYALLCQNSLDLIFYLYWQWVNSTVGWIPPRPGWNCAAGKGAGLGDASCLSQGENCFRSHNSHNTSPFLACSSEGHIWRGGECFRWFSVCFLFSYVCTFFFFFFFFFIREEMKSLSGSHMSNSTSAPNKGV